MGALPGFCNEWERWAADSTESHVTYLPLVVVPLAEPAPGAVISLSYAEFVDDVGRLREVNFPIEREPEAAWPHFAGWRVNYEQAVELMGTGPAHPPPS